jgi:hypothetical protein
LYDDFVVTISEKHAAEKVALQKRIETLERDARKANREIKGLRYLVMNGTGGETGSSPDLLGTDVPRSVLAGKSVLMDRPSSLGVPVNTKPTMGPSLDFTPSDILGSLHGFEHRLSVSSLASSADSSTSSLSSSDLTPAMVLPVIPEASPPSSVPDLENPHDPVTAAVLGIEKQKEKEERRASRVLHRISSSSTTASVTPPAVAATTAYPTNLKRGRPPSIAQVLDDSQNMEDVLEKLRPFGGLPAPFNP